MSTTTNHIITEALRKFDAGKRHPCEVTADRLGDHLDRYGARITPDNRDLIAQVRFLLQQLADGVLIP